MTDYTNYPGTADLDTGLDEECLKELTEDGARRNFRYWMERDGGDRWIKTLIQVTPKKKGEKVGDHVARLMAKAMFKGYMAAYACRNMRQALKWHILNIFREMGLSEDLLRILSDQEDKASGNRYFGSGSASGVEREQRVEVAVEIMKMALAPNQSEIIEALALIQGFVPEFSSEALDKAFANDSWDGSGHYPPLMTEALTYAVFGKDDARSLLGRWRGLLEALGIDKNEVWQRVAKMKKAGRGLVDDGEDDDE